MLLSLASISSSWLTRWPCYLRMQGKVYMQAGIGRLERDIEGLQESRRVVQEDKANAQRLHQAAEVRGRELEDQVGPG